MINGKNSTDPFERAKLTLEAIDLSSAKSYYPDDVRYVEHRISVTLAEIAEMQAKAKNDFKGVN